MKYFKVKHQFNGAKMSSPNMYHVANELFTEKECEKKGVNKSYCDEIETSKFKTHILFGARFETSLFDNK